MERKRAKPAMVAGDNELMENGELLSKKRKSSLQGDEGNIALLLFLYTLQGIPLGLSAAVPMILQNRGVSYKEQVRIVFLTICF